MTRRDFLGGFPATAVLAAMSPALLAACSRKKGYKLGVADWSLMLASNPASFQAAKQIGLDGVQVSMPFDGTGKFFATPAQLDAYKAAMKTTGLMCASTASMLNSKPFVSSEGAVEYVCGTLDAAADLGAADILVPFYGKANLAGKDKRLREDLFKELIPRLKEAAAHAEKKKVSICLENTLNAEDDLRIIDAVGSEYVKVYFDIFNFQYYGFETVPEMLKLKGHIGQIHLKDKGHRLDSGSGMPRNMQYCFDAIEKIGYDGWLVFELHGHNPQKDGSIESVLRHNAEYVKKSSLFRG